MANRKVVDLPELTTLSNDDELYIVDISDLTESSEGTSKKIKASNFVPAGGELIANKQNSLTSDGTGIKYPTVDAVNVLDANLIHKDSTPETKIGGLTLGTNLANANDKWVAFGTSVTDLDTYTVPTSLQLNLTLLNYGVSGSTSNSLAGLYSSIPTWTDEYRLLSIEYGINDSSTAVLLATFRTNIENCIVNAKSKGWPDNRILVINGNYCTNAPMVTTLVNYANEAILIAKEQGVQYYDAYNYTLNNGAGDLLSDGVHPTAAGGLVYARGLIASMHGGMEITNGLTVDNGLSVLGIINADKQITTLASIKTGQGINNNPANTVVGDIIVPLNAGVITQHSQAGIISKFTPLEDFGSGVFGMSIRNYTENSQVRFYTAGAVRGSQILAMQVNSAGDVSFLKGLSSSENIGIAYNKAFQYSGAFTNKMLISDLSGHTTFYNGFSTGLFSFYVSNGVTNAANLALRIANSKNILVNTTTDNGVDKLQVNGTISMSPATLSNQGVVKSQLSTQYEVGANSNVLDVWMDNEVIFTASCTITVPATLPTNFNFNWLTLAGVTVTWAITSPHTWLFGTPGNATEKTYGRMVKRNSTNSIIML